MSMLMRTGCMSGLLNVAAHYIAECHARHYQGTGRCASHFQWLLSSCLEAAIVQHHNFSRACLLSACQHSVQC